MRLRNLRYFLAVAEEQSFTRAAARVHIEPSPLYRAIRKLESDLQLPLIHHRQGRLRLTPAGEAFRDEARHIVAIMESARTRVYFAERGSQGQLRIGLADPLAQPPLIRLLARCREEEPQTAIRILEMSVGEMVEALNHDRIDAGFTVHPEPGEALRKLAVWRDRLAVALPRNHPLLSLLRIPWHEISRCPVLLFHPEFCPGGYDLVHRWLFHIPSSSPRIAEYVSSHEAMLMLAAAGYRIGVGLESQITLYHTPGVIVRPVADVPATATFLLLPLFPERPLSETLSHFVAHVRQIGQFSSAGELGKPLTL
jgi:DNA-binding transcriptional LysR family regulator